MNYIYQIFQMMLWTLIFYHFNNIWRKMLGNIYYAVVIILEITYTSYVIILYSLPTVTIAKSLLLFTQFILSGMSGLVVLALLSHPRRIWLNVILVTRGSIGKLKCGVIPLFISYCFLPCYSTGIVSISLTFLVENGCVHHVNSTRPILHPSWT